MTHQDLLVYGLMLVCSGILCALVYLRNLRQRLPFFSLYAAAVFGCGLITGAIYYLCGFRSVTSYYAGWLNVGVNLFLRCLAIAELCRYKLRAYRGVWELTWRFLLLLSVVFLANAALDAWGQPNRLAIYGLTIERDVAISSIVILSATLLVRTYYGLRFEALQKWIAIGLCVLALVDLVNNTMLHSVFTGYLSPWFHTNHSTVWPSIQAAIESANASWWAIRTAGLVIATGGWCYALRSALPTPEHDPVLLPAEVYAELSPAMNLRLRTFNDSLVELLRS